MKLETSLTTALNALQNQIDREMQRSPLEMEAKGMRKWEPFQTRVERVAGFIVESLADNKISLDSLIVLSQALSKSLQVAVTEIGKDCLGKTRSEYCLHAAEQIKRDAKEIEKTINDTYSLT
jgi:hypothetical protein